MDTQILWSPSKERMQASHATHFIELVNRSFPHTDLTDFHSLYAWSITHQEQFWRMIWDFVGVKTSRPVTTVMQSISRVPGTLWFPGTRLNFAENLLREKSKKRALVFWGEDKVKTTLSYEDLHLKVAQVAAYLKACGVGVGDRVAGYLPNVPETIISMLAATSLGAIWSSCSPDFGVSGLVDRFGQIEPKVLIAANGYFHKGEALDCLGKVREALREISSVKHSLIVPYTQEKPDISNLPQASLFSDITASGSPRLQCEQLPFDHPLYIMYSSGTTGKPKCIVHGAGGTLLEHLKELIIHTDLKKEDTIFYQTTCGWMMWNWLVSSLATGATLLLYDGAPFHNNGNILFDFADAERMTIFGTNAKYISALEKAGLQPKKTHQLKSLKTILSTGSPLLPENFDYVYTHIKQDVLLSSISGGTDIIGCFALGTPLLPVRRGELQTRSLGLRVEVFDDTGKAVQGKKGELVCSAPFPSMPIQFWNDPSGDRYQQAYFERFPNVWTHGDYVELTLHNGMIFYGRSDAVLNPGGIRIGTAEIYRQVEALPEIAEALVVGQTFQGDERVILFLRLQEGLSLSEPLKERIKTTIRQNTTPFHVPRKIVQVKDIPRTKSGKIVELAIKNIIHAEPIKNIEALANPEALTYFRDLPELKEP